MYQRSHIYLTQKITGSKNPYLLFGSLFPDFHQLGSLPAGFDLQYKEFLSFLKGKYPDLLPFGMGMTLHETPFGVDRFIHQAYNGGPGYAFQFVEGLLEDTKRVFDCDD